MNNYKECLSFIENNKIKYLKFLCENFEGFPFVCDYSSQKIRQGSYHFQTCRGIGEFRI